jgi:hypothetical protein
VAATTLEQASGALPQEGPGTMQPFERIFARRFVTAVRVQVAQVGPRLRQHVTRPSRAIVVHTVTLVLLIGLSVFEVPGLLQFVAVGCLVALLRSEHLREQRELTTAAPVESGASHAPSPEGSGSFERSRS